MATNSDIHPLNIHDMQPNVTQATPASKGPQAKAQLKKNNLQIPLNEPETPLYSRFGTGLAPDLEQLNAQYKNLDAFSRIQLLFSEFRPEEILVTSSFGITSGVLLRMVSQIAAQHPVHFLDTTYHFAETLQYQQQLHEKLRLNIVNLLPDPVQNAHTRDTELWKTNPDACCAINKVAPLQPLKSRHSVWISGLLSDQNEHRSQLSVFTQKPGEIIKFQPLIDMTHYDALLYLLVNELPYHPLMELGYDSIGCTHCTKPGTSRMGRWVGFIGKTECGLHV